MIEFLNAPIDDRGYLDVRPPLPPKSEPTLATCSYCGVETSYPCRNTRDMEELPDVDRPECFAALMFLGGGERSESQNRAAHYWRMVAGEIAKTDMVGGPARDLCLF